jgi:2-dehydropantoate 2-reductase
MRVAIVGSGGVGGYFGGRLAAAGHDVSFVARGGHLAALKKNGLRIESPLGALHLESVTATDDPSIIGPVDVVFFTVKLYDTAAALERLPPLIGRETVVISFQNGVDSVEVLTKALGRAHVAGGTTYVAASIAEPGVIKHTAMNRLVFGPVDGKPSRLLTELVTATSAAGIDSTLSDRIMAEIWTKFVRLTVFSGMTAIARAPIGTVLASPELVTMLQAALHESIAVARAVDIPLPDTMFDDLMVAFQALPAEAKSSMLDDLEKGKPLELPWLSGALVRIGEQAGVPTPTHRLIVGLLWHHVSGRPDRQFEIRRGA